MVTDSEWMSTVSYTPLLRYSILAPLLREYIPDGVGISPTTIQHTANDTGTEGDTKMEKGGKPVFNGTWESNLAIPRSFICDFAAVVL